MQKDFGKMAHAAHAGRQKDIPLEAVRGVAAVTVVVWHTTLGFFPGLTGNFPDTLGDGFSGQPWYGLMFGTAAVTLFFVLSGYVLTRRFLLTGERSIIVRSALKRWPRLAGPVLVSVLISFVLLSLGLYRYDQAGALTHSPWLVGHLFKDPQILPWKFADAVAQGVYFTFFQVGSAYWNTVLWTMRWEFMGSFYAFGLALLIQPMTWRQRALILVVVTMITRNILPDLIPFPVGVALAALLPKDRVSKPVVAFVALAIGLYLMGYSGRAVGTYAWLAHAIGAFAPALFVQTLAAALIIIAVEISALLRTVLSHRISAWLGAMSFPLYLIHIPMLCSFGSMAAIGTGRGVGGAVVTLVASFLAATPLRAFNDWWVALLNRKLDGPRPAAAAAMP